MPFITGRANSRTSKEIADRVARYGASLSAGANSDYTIVAASSLKQFSDHILELLADVVLEPSFPENEVELAKQNTKESLRQQRAQPSFLAAEMVSRAMFGDHPYAIVAPTLESIDRSTRDDFVNFHRAKFVPNNAVFVVVGDVGFNDVVNQLESLFSTWNKGAELMPIFGSPVRADAHTSWIRPAPLLIIVCFANSAITRATLLSIAAYAYSLWSNRIVAVVHEPA